MKKLITLALLASAVCAKAQMTEEHSYTESRYPVTVCHLEDYGEKYLMIDTGTRNIILMNDNHTVFKTINVGIPANAGSYLVQLTSQYFFNNDSKIEVYVFWGVGTSYQGRIVNEDGVVLQNIADAGNSTAYKVNGNWKVIMNMVHNPAYGDSRVFSVPGQWAGVVETGHKTVSPSDIYPNPMNTAATIRYELPAGQSSGTINVYNMQGALLRTYAVSNAFNDIMIERNELPAGTYTYDIVTAKGKQGGQKFLVQ